MNIKYAKSHEWIAFMPDGKLRVGLTRHAIDALGDIVFFDLPAVGDAVSAGASFGNVETVKAVSDLYSPADGVVTAVNAALLDDPSAVSDDPASFLIEIGDAGEPQDLLDEAAYKLFCEEEGNG